MVQRFERTARVIGWENLQRLAQTTVAVVGLGGVGGYTAEALARSGIGALILIDRDLISLTNINRQIIALESTLGRPKVEVMAERIRQINPACSLSTHQLFFDSKKHGALLSAADYIADAIDSVSAKAGLIEYCLAGGLPIISALGTGNKLDPTRLTVTDLAKTHTCPLARALRACLRKKGIAGKIPVVFSPEAPAGERERFSPGSTAFVPPAAGLIMAGWIVENICREG